MARQATARSTSRIVATKPGCAPLWAMYTTAKASGATSWSQIEAVFVRAMEQFDSNVASGTADIGDLQNGKGDFFNDLLALLLENCAGVTLYSRRGVPGLVYPNHNLDLTYPSGGIAGFVLEAKAVGTPRHPLSPRQVPIGRRGSADLQKRIQEVAFKTIDLKAEYGRIMAGQGKSPTSIPGGNLTSWLRSVPPRAYLFITARVVDERDFDAVVRHARAAAQVLDGVGLFCFTPVSVTAPTQYRVVPVPVDLSIDRVLYRACQDVLGLRA